MSPELFVNMIYKSRLCVSPLCLIIHKEIVPKAVNDTNDRRRAEPENLREKTLINILSCSWYGSAHNCNEGCPIGQVSHLKEKSGRTIRRIMCGRSQNNRLEGSNAPNRLYMIGINLCIF